MGVTKQKPKWLKKKFEIVVWYFKDTGKFYTEAKFTREFCCNEGGGCYMPDVVAHIRGLRDSDGSGALPGLSEYSEGWDGYIIVNCENGHPCLIAAPKKPEQSKWDMDTLRRMDEQLRKAGTVK